MNTRPDPYANIPAVGREQVRETLALQALKNKRLTGEGSSDAQIVAEHGYSDANAFWNVWTSGTMEVVKLIQSLSILSSDPTPYTYQLAKTYLCKAMDEAIATNQPWLIRDHNWDDLEKRKLHPRDAAQWLLSQPKWANLVPDGLRTFIERRDNPDSPKGSLRAKPGAPCATDWVAFEEALAVECREKGCVPPDREGPKGWQTQADVVRWTHDWLSDRGDNASESTVKAHVSTALTALNGQK